MQPRKQNIQVKRKKIYAPNLSKTKIDASSESNLWNTLKAKVILYTLA